MAMDDESFVVRWKRRPKPKEILGQLSIAHIADYFTVEPDGSCRYPRRWIGRIPNSTK